jgi:hypothetical protein
VIEGFRDKMWFAPLLGVTGLAVLATGVIGSPAQAVDDDTDSTTVSVRVTGAITLADLTPSFELTGAPGTEQTTAEPVSMTVITNNFAGYTVTVQPAAANLMPLITDNTDVIPFSSIGVLGPNQEGTYAQLATLATVVATKTSPSAVNGDTVTNTFRLTVPSVRPDTYSGSLTYVVTTL